MRLVLRHDSAKSVGNLAVDPLNPPFILRQLFRRIGLSIEAVLLAKVA